MSPDVAALPDGVDVAVIATAAELVADTLAAVGDQGIPTAILIPPASPRPAWPSSPRTAREHGVRFVGPNVSGVYYTPANMSAAPTAPYASRVRSRSRRGAAPSGWGSSASAARRSSGCRRSSGSAMSADIDEDDLLTFFEHDENTSCVALHIEDLEDGRAFVEVARRVSRKKPIVVLKAGATPARDEKLYDDLLRQAGVVRARGLGELLQFARSPAAAPDAQGRERRDHRRGRRRGRSSSDACARSGLHLMTIPEDLREDFMVFIRPFGTAANPIDIAGASRRRPTATRSSWRSRTIASMRWSWATGIRRSRRR